MQSAFIYIQIKISSKTPFQNAVTGNTKRKVMVQKKAVLRIHIGYLPIQIVKRVTRIGKKAIAVIST